LLDLPGDFDAFGLGLRTEDVAGEREGFLRVEDLGGERKNTVTQLA